MRVQATRPLIMTAHPVIIITAQATIIVLMIIQVQIAHRPIQGEVMAEVVIKQKTRTEVLVYSIS